eukprot:XP_001706500.1 Hypothetical protein GL50803_10176 [Giardia lamblia ATCC 50803]
MSLVTTPSLMTSVFVIGATGAGVDGVGAAAGAEAAPGMSGATPFVAAAGPNAGFNTAEDGPEDPG